MYAEQLYKYRNRVQYHRGHLVPSMTYSSTKERFVSTYVYTNIVPQHAAFNCGQWSLFEDTIRLFAANQCIPKSGTLYLLTGTAFVHVQPGNPPQLTHPARNRLGGNTGILIPNSLWTAGCCVNANGLSNSFAAIGNNDQNPHFMRITLAQLQNILREDAARLNVGGQNVNLFPGNPNCVNHNLPDTVLA